MIQDVGMVGGSLYLAKGLSVLNRLLLWRFLGPFQMGIWSTLLVILDWSKYSSLGVAAGLTQEIPLAVSKKELGRAEEAENLSISFSLFSTVLFVFGIYLVTFLFRKSMEPLLFQGILWVGVVVIFQRFYHALVFVLNGYQNFQFIGQLTIISSVSVFLLTLLLVPYAGILGWIAALLLNCCLGIALAIPKIPKFRLVPFNQKILSLIVTGMGVLGVEMLISAFRSIDRIVITSVLGFKAMGYYSIALTVSTGVYTLPYALGTVTLPHYQQESAKGWTDKKKKRLVIKPILALIYILPLFIWGCSLVLPYVIAKWARSYEPSVPALQVLTAGTFFLCLTPSLTSFLLTIRERVRLFAGAIFLLVTLCALEFYFAKAGFGILGIAFASSAAYFLYFSLTFFLAAPAFLKWAEAAKIYLKILFVFTYMVAFLMISNQLLKSLMPRALSLGLGLIPLLFSLARDTEVVQSVREILFKRSKKESAILETEEEV